MNAVRTKKIGVMIVDDSSVMRQLLRSAFESDPEMEIVGHAFDGISCLERVGRLHPEVIVLDLEMPRMDGLQTLRRVRELYPEIHVIIFSSRTEESARATVEALQAGAVDFILKPERATDGDPRSFIQSTLGETIRELKKSATGPLIPTTSNSGYHGAELVVLGISTGGPAALRTVVSSLPANLNGPIVIAQHMPPTFSRLLAESLQQASGLDVCEASDGMILRPGQIYVAPGGKQTEVERGAAGLFLKVSKGHPSLTCKPSVDVLFRSAARVSGLRATGIVMTGMGHDGREGARAIKAARGTIFIQSKDSCLIFGMPGAVAEAGLADAAVPLEEMAGRISQILGVRK